MSTSNKKYGYLELFRSISGWALGRQTGSEPSIQSIEGWRPGAMMVLGIGQSSLSLAPSPRLQPLRRLYLSTPEPIQIEPTCHSIRRKRADHDHFSRFGIRGLVRLGLPWLHYSPSENACSRSREMRIYGPYPAR